MSTRISSAALLVLLAGCSPEASDAAAADEGSLIECAVAGAADFARDCVLEWFQAEGPPYLLIRHPDGGFRRFEWVSARGGPELHTSDGVERAQVVQRGDMLNVAVGRDRYRIPAVTAAHDIQ